jgi:hypothetical protein
MIRKICNGKFHQNLFIRFPPLFHVYGQTDGAILIGASQGYEGVSNVWGCGAASFDNVNIGQAVQKLKGDTQYSDCVSILFSLIMESRHRMATLMIFYLSVKTVRIKLLPSVYSDFHHIYHWRSLLHVPIKHATITWRSKPRVELDRSSTASNHDRGMVITSAFVFCVVLSCSGPIHSPRTCLKYSLFQN